MSRLKKNPGMLALHVVYELRKLMSCESLAVVVNVFGNSVCTCMHMMQCNTCAQTDITHSLWDT